MKRARSIAASGIKLLVSSALSSNSSPIRPAPEWFDAFEISGLTKHDARSPEFIFPTKRGMRNFGGVAVHIGLLATK